MEYFSKVQIIFVLQETPLSQQTYLFLRRRANVNKISSEIVYKIQIGMNDSQQYHLNLCLIIDDVDIVIFLAQTWKPQRKILWKNYKPYLWCPFLKEKLEFATNSDPSSSLQNPSSHWSVREQPGSELGVSHPAPLGLEIASSACPFSPSPRTWIYSTLS